MCVSGNRQTQMPHGKLLIENNIEGEEIKGLFSYIRMRDGQIPICQDNLPFPVIWSRRRRGGWRFQPPQGDTNKPLRRSSSYLMFVDIDGKVQVMQCQICKLHIHQLEVCEGETGTSMGS
jgi:hypothetical protein